MALSIQYPPLIILSANLVLLGGSVQPEKPEKPRLTLGMVSGRLSA
jgi:hypothetical protein